MKTVTAAQANRQFSSMLREVAQGERVLVTSRGKAVATIEPVRASSKGRPGAGERRLLARLAGVRAVGTHRWTRDELYE